VLLLGYSALSIVCWFALVPPVPAPLVPIVATLAGPPALLLWGHQAIAAFAIASAVVLLLVSCGLRSQQTRALVWFGAAVAAWLISGFLSFALSI
jgi:hypothetical protein